MTGRSRRNTAVPTTPPPAEGASATPVPETPAPEARAPEAAAPEATAVAAPDAGAVPNKATTAFEEYRNRMDAAASRFPGGMGVWAGQPVPQPYSYGAPVGGYPPTGGMPIPPSGGYPPAGAMPTPPGAPPFAGPGYGDMPGWGYPTGPQAPWGMPGQSRRSFMESIGTLVWLGVEAANAVLSGTLRAVEGGMGQGAYGPAMPWPGDLWGPPYNAYAGPCECCEHCYGPCCCGCGCNPGVRNCS